jgi:hypothetical protein
MMGVGHLNAARALVKAFTPEEEEARECQDVTDLLALIEEQNLVLQTLLAVLLEKEILTEEEFRKWAAQCDELDGAKDGRLKQGSSPIKP